MKRPRDAEDTTLPVQDVNDSQDTKGSDAGPDADAAAASADDQTAATVSAEGPVTQASVELIEEVLNKMQKDGEPCQCHQALESSNKGAWRGQGRGRGRMDTRQRRKSRRRGNGSNGPNGPGRDKVNDFALVLQAIGMNSLD
ncbi:hypothetical protein QBC47DRAFT_36107 [Echria macrotheca]|uniref:Uncharacterized protein n=1 Tax=Echria macrotheca TaxID=438768 RepID=A0AAJ0F416_9PEZI|nr:hypothetical protein QBC47DRAFT_36107 [Echria macrotheca]